MTLVSIALPPHTEAAMTSSRTYKIPLVLAAAAGIVAAQTPKAQALLMAMGANAKQAATYQWKQKTTIVRKGNPTGHRLDEVRFDATGQMHRVTLVQPEEKKMGPLKARKAAAVKEDLQEVMQLAGRYANPQQMAATIRKGELWEGVGSLRVQARAAVLPTDEVTITFSASTFLPIRADIKTQHEGSPVAIVIDYQQLPNGPAMLARMTVQIPGDSIAVNVESFDYVRLAGSNFN